MRKTISRILAGLAAVFLLTGTVGGAEYFVSTSGLDSNSGTNWGQSLRTISNAVAKAVNPGDIVTVSNGTYNISADIMVTQAITIRSFGNGITGGLTNAANTILSRGNGRWNFYITAAATVDGFTGTGCQAGNGGGGNFYVSATAMVYNCILRNNGGSHNTKGFGGYIVSGIISNCLIYGNYNTDRMTWGGGLYIDGGTVVACKIYSNNMLAVANQSSGGGVSVRGGTVRNCLIYGNAAGEGGGVFIEGGTVESCTIAGNIAGNAFPSSGRGGGIYRWEGNRGTVLNCIVYNNTAIDATYKNSYSTSSGWTYNDSTLPDVAGTGCISTDPKLTNDYTLLASSPCIDVGTNQSWMTSATDLFRNPRKVLGGGVNSADPIVDMGAYEYGWQAEPIIKNQLPSNSTTNSATFNGWLVSTGFSDNAVCVHWGMSNGTTNNGAWVNTNWFTGISWTNNSFPSTNLIGLVTDTTYYYTFIASNVAGVVAATLPTNVMYLITGGVTVDSSGDSTVKYPTDMTGTFTISRPIGASSESLIVSYSTTNGSPTATNGIDYALSGASLLNSGTAATGSVYMAAGSSNVVLTLIPLSEVPVNKSAILTLTTGVGNYALGVVTQQTITILAAPSTVQFWTGATNSQWTNAGNWTNSAGAGVVPTNLPYSAVINGGSNQPVILDLTNGYFTIGALAIGQVFNSTVVFSNGNVSNKYLSVTNYVVIGTNGTLTHTAETAQSRVVDTENHRLFMVVGGNMTIAPLGKIDVTGKGYYAIVRTAGGMGPGFGGTLSVGAGYGGLGGGGGTTYGSVTNPVNSGSSGCYHGNGSFGKAGGGTVVITVGGLFSMSGSILADGNGSPNAAESPGAGSGGSVNIRAGSLSGSGTISAKGGSFNIAPGGGSGGGGGRIAIVLTNQNDNAFTNLAINTYGGTTISVGHQYGGAGTVYLKGTNQTYGKLIVNQAVGGNVTLIQNQTLNLDTIEATNNAYIAMGSGGILDLQQGCVLRSYVGGSRFLLGYGGQILWPSAYTVTNVTFSWVGTNGFSITSDMTVASGGILTHEGNTTTEANKLIATIVGNLTVNAGGIIGGTGLGYGTVDYSRGPGAPGQGYRGAGYGGYGGNSGGQTYGSITNPVNLGSSTGTGGNYGAGGGAVILNIRDQLSVNGIITANGFGGGNACGGGAGGSVNIVAGSLSGTNSITANGAASDGSGGGGGRISIVLTNANDSVFTNLTITTYGGLSGTYGAAGTVYIKGTNQTYGTLIIDNRNSTTADGGTLVSTLVTDTEVGDVKILRAAKFQVVAGGTVTVHGVWTNAVGLSGISGTGTVVFAGDNPTNFIFGATSWPTIDFRSPITNVSFPTSTVQVLYGTLIASNGITYRSKVDGVAWSLQKISSGGDGGRILHIAKVKDSNASSGLSMRPNVGSTDLGSNTNWSFSDTNFPNVWWEGTVSSSWDNPTNWSPVVVPTLTNDVKIQGGYPNLPTLDLINGPNTIGSMMIGGVTSTLSISNGNVTTKYLSVTGDVSILSGGIVTHAANAGSENHRLCLVVSNNLTIAAGGQINVVGMGYAVGQGPGAPTAVIYNVNGSRGGGGYGGQGGIYNTTTITYGSITNPVNNGSGGYPAAGASAGGGCVVLRVTGVVTHNGTINTRGLDSTYRGPGSGGSINVTASSIAGSGVLSADGGVNVEGTGHGGGGRIAVKLTGGGTVPDSILTNITACSPLPDATSAAAGTIYIQDGSRTNLIVDQKSRTSYGTFANIALPYTLWRNDTNQFSTIIVTNSAMLMVGTNAQLNLDGCTLLTPPSTTNSITSRLIVRDNGMLNWTGTWTNNGCISWYSNNYAQTWPGSLVVASNAFLTHEYGAGNAIRLSLTGDLIVTNGGSVYVSGRGNAGISPPSRMGSGHGGEGGIGMVDGGGPVRGTTYGSIINPITQGSQGSYPNPVGYAGGVAILRVAGTLRVNGSVAADGIVGGSGSSAGSVNVVAGAVLGSGSISANGGDANNAGGGGGGGRIAIVLTNTTLFGGVAISAVGGTAPIGGTPPWEHGGAGTIYLKGTNQTYGTLILDNGSRSTGAKTVISPSVTDYAQFDDVVLRNLAFLDLNTNTMSVYGNWSNMVSGVAMTNGTVIFAGSNPQYIYGDNNWSNLTFSTAGTTIYFQPVKTQRIIGTLTNQSPTTFRSITDGAGWRLTKTGTGIESLSGVIFVKDSDASGGKTMSTPFASRDLGGNINWLFTSGIKIQQYFNIFDARNLLDP